jgi:hypothetical protein
MKKNPRERSCRAKRFSCPSCTYRESEGVSDWRAKEAEWERENLLWNFGHLSFRVYRPADCYIYTLYTWLEATYYIWWKTTNYVVYIHSCAKTLETFLWQIVDELFFEISKYSARDYTISGLDSFFIIHTCWIPFLIFYNVLSPVCYKRTDICKLLLFYFQVKNARRVDQ